VLHLDARKGGPVVLVCDIVHFGKLPQVDVRRSNVAHFAGLDEVVERLHGFFNSGILVAAMDDEYVDIGGTKSFERSFNLVEKCSTGETALVHIVALVNQLWFPPATPSRRIVVRDNEPCLGNNDEVVAGNIVLAWCLSIRVIERLKINATALRNLPTISSDSPFEYMFAVSTVLIPQSQAALRMGRACTRRQCYASFSICGIRPLLSGRIQGYCAVSVGAQTGRERHTLQTGFPKDIPPN
jgi:hypothetical protein